jgi:hypothetical protein
MWKLCAMDIRCTTPDFLIENGSDRLVSGPWIESGIFHLRTMSHFSIKGGLHAWMHTRLNRFGGLLSHHFTRPLTEDQIMYYKLLDELPAIICETEQRCQIYETFNIPAITYESMFLNGFQYPEVNNVSMITLLSPTRFYVAEGSLINVVKRIFKAKGLKYISYKKVQELILSQKEA